MRAWRLVKVLYRINNLTLVQGQVGQALSWLEVAAATRSGSPTSHTSILSQLRLRWLHCQTYLVPESNRRKD